MGVCAWGEFTGIGDVLCGDGGGVGGAAVGNFSRVEEEAGGEVGGEFEPFSVVIHRFGAATAAAGDVETDGLGMGDGDGEHGDHEDDGAEGGAGGDAEHEGNARDDFEPREGVGEESCLSEIEHLVAQDGAREFIEAGSDEFFSA